MKLKPIYIYLILISVALITIVIFSSDKSNENVESSDNSLPNDHIHESIATNQQSPSSGNVSREYLEKMAELEEAISSNPNDTLKLHEYADFLSAAHKEKESIEYYKRILDIDNERIDILLRISVVNFNIGKFREAKEYIVKSLAIEENNTKAIYNLGVVEARIGDLDAAKKQWEDLIANHPNTKMSDMAKESLERLSSK